MVRATTLLMTVWEGAEDWEKGDCNEEGLGSEYNGSCLAEARDNLAFCSILLRTNNNKNQQRRSETAHFALIALHLTSPIIYQQTGPLIITLTLIIALILHPSIPPT